MIMSHLHQLIVLDRCQLFSSFSEERVTHINCGVPCKKIGFKWTNHQTCTPSPSTTGQKEAAFTTLQPLRSPQLMTFPLVPRHYIIAPLKHGRHLYLSSDSAMQIKPSQWACLFFLNSQAVTHWKHEAAVGNGRLVDPEGVCNNHPLGQDDTSVTMRRQSAKPQNQCLVWNLGFWYLTEIASTLKVEPWNEFKKYFESSTCYCSDMTRETWTELKRLSQPETCKGFLSKTFKDWKISSQLSNNLKQDCSIKSSRSSLLNVSLKAGGAWRKIYRSIFRKCCEKSKASPYISLLGYDLKSAPRAFPQCWENCLFSNAIAMQMWPVEGQCVVGLNLPRRNRHRKSPFQSLLDYASSLWRFLQAQPTLRLLYTSEVKLQTFSSVCRPHDNGAKVLHGAFKPYDCMVDITKRTWNDSI